MVDLTYVQLNGTQQVEPNNADRKTRTIRSEKDGIYEYCFKNSWRVINTDWREPEYLQNVGWSCIIWNDYKKTDEEIFLRISESGELVVMKPPYPEKK